MTRIHNAIKGLPCFIIEKNEASDKTHLHIQQLVLLLVKNIFIPSKLSYPFTIKPLQKKLRSFTIGATNPLF